MSNQQAQKKPDNRTDTQVLLDWLVKKIVRNSEVRGIESNATEIVSDIIEKTYVPFGIKVMDIENRRKQELADLKRKESHKVINSVSNFLNKKKQDNIPESDKINKKYNDEMFIATGKFLIKCDEIDEQLKYTGIQPLHEMFAGFSPAVPVVEQRVRIALLMCQDQMNDIVETIKKQGILEHYKEKPSKEEINEYMMNSVDKHIKERDRKEKLERNKQRARQLETIEYEMPMTEKKTHRAPPDFGF